VLLPDDVRVEDARGRVERVDGRVDAQFGDRATEHRLRVQVREGGGGRGVGQVVCRHVYRLNARYRALSRGRYALLHGAHVGREGGLVADGGGDAAQQRGHLRARLREPALTQHTPYIHTRDVYWRYFCGPSAGKNVFNLNLF